MELIKKLGTRIHKNGYLISYGLFLCSFCLQEVEKRLNVGKTAKSCGCKKIELSAIGHRGKKLSKEHVKKLRLSNIGKKRTEETKYKQSKIKKGKKRKPFNEETKQKIRENRRKQIPPNKGKKFTEEHKHKLSISHKGDKCYLWQGGKSFEPYSPEFNKELKIFIKQRDNYTCQNPNCEHKSIKLDIHHIDYDKKNNNPENLITLCKSCHIKTNFKRNYFTEFYKNTMLTKLVECLL